MFSLESPRSGDSNEYIQYTIFNIKKRKSPYIIPETQERARNSRGKRAISVRATEVLLYLFIYLNSILFCLLFIYFVISLIYILNKIFHVVRVYIIRKKCWFIHGLEYGEESSPPAKMKALESSYRIFVSYKYKFTE